MKPNKQLNKLQKKAREQSKYWDRVQSYDKYSANFQAICNEYHPGPSKREQIMMDIIENMRNSANANL